MICNMTIPKLLSNNGHADLLRQKMVWNAQLNSVDESTYSTYLKNNVNIKK